MSQNKTPDCMIAGDKDHLPGKTATPDSIGSTINLHHKDPKIDLMPQVREWMEEVSRRVEEHMRPYFKAWEHAMIYGSATMSTTELMVREEEKRLMLGEPLDPK